MSNSKNIRKMLCDCPAVSSLGYLLVFLFLLWPAHHGLGLLWDWDWSLFPENLRTLSSGFASTWSDYYLGQASTYNSDLYIKYLLSWGGYSHIGTEHLLYGLLVLLATFTAYGVFLCARKKLAWHYSFLLGLVAVLNPAYLYKLMAGHLMYLISLAIFIWLIYFLYYKYRNNLKSALILGLLLAFVGAQIQFFIFAAIVIFVWYLVRRILHTPACDSIELIEVRRGRENTEWEGGGAIKARYLLVAVGVALLINLPWLSNFLVGANSITGISSQAEAVAFGGATYASMVRIATMVFADATLIKYFYPKWAFAFFGLFSLGLAGMAIWRIFGNRKQYAVRSTQISRAKQKFTSVQQFNDETIKQSGNYANCAQRTAHFSLDFWTVLITLLIFVFLGTGVYQNWNIPGVRIFYPMLRESGHFAPVIILFMILLLIRLWSNKNWIKWPIIAYMLVFAGINGYTIFKSLPTVNYQALRDHMEPYKEFLDQDSSIYRIAVYPFFGQYSVAWEENKEVRGQPVRNTGIDLFTQSSKYDALSNYVSAQKLDDTVQYQFLTTFDLSLLEDRGIKYLLDFSDIYESNIEKYSDPSYYHNDLSIVKNNPDLFDSLLQKYPDRFKLVAPHIYQLTQTKPRLSFAGEEINVTKNNASSYKIEIKNFSESGYLNFNSTFHPDWVLNLAGQKIATNKHDDLKPYGQSWYLDYNEVKKIALEKGVKINDNGSINLTLDLYFWPQQYFSAAKYAALITIFGSIIALLIIYLRQRLPRHA